VNIERVPNRWMIPKSASLSKKKFPRLISEQKSKYRGSEKVRGVFLKGEGGKVFFE
tara:strand:+ start:23892 stop:24059 length:168 start_codon:yes stop_codon:yes gene_type:complete